MGSIPIYRVGIFGSATSAGADLIDRAGRIGRALAERNCGIITGACSGLPYAAARTAAACGAEVWGFSPMLDLEGQREFVPDDDPGIYSKLIYIPPSFEFIDSPEVRKKYRNVISTAHCDAGIIIAGRWGTLHEFTSLVDFGKVVGVLTGTGEIADELPHLVSVIDKPGSATILFNDSPEELAERVITELDRRSAG
jgi:predicted Rossmann-fold nucleotide-binding protein